MENIKWAVLGTGVIANEMAQTLAKNGRRIYSVANRTYQKAVDFAKNIILIRFMRIWMMFLRILMWM